VVVGGWEGGRGLLLLLLLLLLPLPPLPPPLSPPLSPPLPLPLPPLLVALVYIAVCWRYGWCQLFPGYSYSSHVYTQTRRSNGHSDPRTRGLKAAIFGRGGAHGNHGGNNAFLSAVSRVKLRCEVTV
jgi:hypothetical protein